MSAGKKTAQAVATREMPGGATLAVTVLFELEEGAFESFHRRVKQCAIETIAKEAGCLRFDVLTPIDALDAPDVLLYEVYVDHAAFDTHLELPHFKAFDESTRAQVRRKSVTFFSITQNARQPASAPHTSDEAVSRRSGQVGPVEHSGE